MLTSAQTDAIVTQVSCGAFSRITWSAHDTPETVRQIKAANAAYDAVCGVVPK